MTEIAAPQSITFHDNGNTLTFDELIPEPVVNDRIREIGAHLAPWIAERPRDTVVVPILTGATRFTDSMLVRAAATEPQIEPRVDAVKIQSYARGTQAGRLQVVQGLSQSVRSQRVIVVDEVIDGGGTVHHLVEKMLKPAGPESITVVTLVSKPEAHTFRVQEDVIGFNVPASTFLIGWGMDWAGKGRWLNWIGNRRVEGTENTATYQIPALPRLAPSGR